LALTPAEKREARELFEAGNACGDCGGLHKRACPRIRRQVWLRTGPGAGERVEVEYWPPGWDDTGVIWPDDAYDLEDADG
jgi:hypothetical protein